jgi:hypothetical protein
MSTRSPVLFLVFNRPDTTQRVFDAIRAARPLRLYVAADGPRQGRAGDTELCKEVRRIATGVDWPCELVTLMRDENLGCKRAVSSAITWFFDIEPEGIVLEDDCLPDPSFFAYCDALLERYRNDERVMCISGDNFISAQWQPEHSYYFSRYAHIWGWASWARAWQHYCADLDMEPVERMEGVLSRVFADSRSARDHWRRLLMQVAAGRIDTWDYQWSYALWKHGGLSCVPRANLISNIGFGPGATHTTSAESKLSKLPVSNLASTLVHPPAIHRASSADVWTDSEVFGIPTRRTIRLAAINALGRTWLAMTRAHRQASSADAQHGTKE